VLRPRSRPALLAGLFVVAATAAIPAFAQHNLSFETIAEDAAGEPDGWSIAADGYAVDLDSAVAQDGNYSLRITRIAAGRTARVTQSMAAELIEGNRVRLSGHVRTEAVSTGYASLWLRVDGPDGLLYIDRMRDRAANGTNAWTRVMAESPLPPEAVQVTFGAILRGSGTAWFDQLVVEGWDTRALPEPSASANRYLTHALSIMQENSINRAAIDWTGFRAETVDQARGAKDTADTYLALRYALRRLGDGHSYLMTARQSARLTNAPVSNARTGRRSIEPRGQMLATTIGYVWIPGFAGGDQRDQMQFADYIQGIVATLESQGSCGWIVDLRDNTGGNLWPMLAGLGPLLGDADVGAAVYPNGRSKTLWYRGGRAGFGDYVQLRVSGEPYRLAADGAPVAVLIGPETASSGEAIVAAFRGRDDSLSFGSATRGMSTGNRTFPLSDGAALVLAVAATADRTGRVYRGALTPDVTVASDDPRSPLTEQATIRAATRWLTQHDACRGQLTH